MGVLLHIPHNSRRINIKHYSAELLCTIIPLTTAYRYRTSHWCERTQEAKASLPIPYTAFCVRMDKEELAAIHLSIEQSETGRYISPTGEEWRQIRFPKFRVADSPRAWRWVSSNGRLLSTGGYLLDRKTNGQYTRTTLPVREREGTWGGTRSVGVHRIVAFTYLTDASDDEELERLDKLFEVDHIDRCPHNNTVGNLRFVSFQENMNNRERLTFTASVDGRIFKRIGDVADVVNVSREEVRFEIDRGSIGNTITVNGTEVKIIHKTKRAFADVTTTVNKKRKTVERKCHERAMDMYLQGASIQEILMAWVGTTPVKEATLYNYLRMAAQEKTHEELNDVALRLGLGTERDQWAPLLQALDNNLVIFHEEYRTRKAKGDTMSSEEYLEGVRQIMSRHVSETMMKSDDWRVLHAVYKILISNGRGSGNKSTSSCLQIHVAGSLKSLCPHILNSRVASWPIACSSLAMLSSISICAGVGLMYSMMLRFFQKNGRVDST